MISVTLVILAYFYIVTVRSIRRKDPNFTSLFLFIFFYFVAADLLLERWRG